MKTCTEEKTVNAPALCFQRYPKQKVGVHLFFIMNSSSPDVTKSRNECILFDTFLSHSSLPQSFNEKAILCHW